MNLEEKIVDAILAELRRQSDAGDRKLQVGANSEGVVMIDGPVNLEELAMAIAGSVSGGP